MRDVSDRKGLLHIKCKSVNIYYEITQLSHFGSNVLSMDVNTISGYNGLKARLNIHITRFSKLVRPTAPLLHPQATTIITLLVGCGLRLPPLGLLPAGNLFLPTSLPYVANSQHLLFPALDRLHWRLDLTSALLIISWRFSSGLKPVPDVLVSFLWGFPKLCYPGVTFHYPFPVWQSCWSLFQGQYVPFHFPS